MRDLSTIETAMTAAETGHLVFATLHTNTAPDAIDRIVGVFPAERQPQIRMRLSTCTKGSTFPTASGKEGWTPRKEWRLVRR